MSKQEFDRTWMQRGAQSRLAHPPPGEDVTRVAAVAFLTGINGLMLDLGSGEGRLEMLLDQGSMVGLDENQTLLVHAKENIKSGASFFAVSGSMLAAPFRRQSFAAVICLNTLENYPPSYVCQLLDEMLVLLKPGGRLIISYRGGASIRMKYHELLHRMHKSGIYQYRFNPRKWINNIGSAYKASVIPLLMKPHGWRRWLGTPADARALLIIDKAG